MTRPIYPLLSQEINDKIFQAYEDLVYLLGYEQSSGSIISGFYDRLDSSGTNTFLSGILSLNDQYEYTSISGYGFFSGYMDIADFLKIDYIYRKYYESEV